MSTRVIPLTVTSRYARSWGTWEGIRELVQNWHDGLHSMASMLDDLPLDTNIKVQFRSFKTKTEEKYEAFVHNPSTDTVTVLGHLTYHWLESRLSLTNQSTALQKKILLLGYSAKANTKEVIGQFGEGLKIGALALVRQGHLVSMETGNDCWKFELLHNEEFGEKVLTVVISERLQELDKDGMPESSSEASGSTCTKISGVESEDWKKFLPRFLFLRPPKDCVKTELGTLLLDKHLSGQLYMKGIWVSDLRGEDLSSGVDFLHLHIDRDRNAVPRPSEIDHQVSGMWVRALDKKPELALQYYSLLKENSSRDVRHAADYATPEMAMLIADHFIREYGENAFPILNQSDAKEIQAVKNELQKTAVLCTDTLIKLLIQSGRYDTFKSALANQRSADAVILPYTNLSLDQRNILQEASRLVNLIDSGFSLSNINVIKTKARETCSVKDGRVSIPEWMMNLDSVHAEMNFDFKRIANHDECKCRESLICLAVLDVRKGHIWQMNQIAPLLPGLERYTPVTLHPLLFVVNSLATQVCGAVSEAYCADLHQQQHGKLDESVMAEFEHREQGYINTIASLERGLRSAQEESIEKVREMERRLQSVEKQLIQKEVGLVNEEAMMAVRYEAELQRMKAAAEESVKGLKQKIDELEYRIIMLTQDNKWKDREVEELTIELHNVSQSLEKKNNVLLEELSHYITQHRNRTVSLARLSTEKRESEDETSSREKWTLISSICDMVLEDLQTEKFICAVCKLKRKSQMVQPCGHYVLCFDCAEQTISNAGICPICKQTTESHVKVFE